MAECEACGNRIEKPGEICPKCGYAPGPQAITSVLKGKTGEKEKKKKKKKTKIDAEVPHKHKNVVCTNCRTNIPGNTNICPKCGLAMSSQTITDLPPWRKK